MYVNVTANRQAYTMWE